MKLIDITFDLESLSLASNAAIVQIAAVVFNRHASSADELFPINIPPFECKVDIRSCVADGFDFSPSTVKWWAEKPEEVKAEVLSGECYPLQEVFSNFIEWLNEVKTATQSDMLCLWAQGSDFDISVLRTILRTYNLEERFPVPYHNYRDARTFIAEIGSHFAANEEALADHAKIYEALPKYTGDGNVHNAVFDCLRTSWSVWQCFSLLPDPA